MTTKAEGIGGWIACSIFGGFILFIIGGCIISGISDAEIREKRMSVRPKAYAWIASHCTGSRIMPDGRTTIWKCGQNEYRFANIINIYLDKHEKVGFNDESDYR